MPRARSLSSSLTKLFDAIASPVYVLDDERRIAFCNEACAAWLGVVAADLVGSQCHYHSAPEVNGMAAVAAGLCPPLEAFSGTRLHGTVTGSGNFRRAEFLPLDDGTNVIAVLAIVDPTEPPPRSELSAGETTDDDLHDAIRDFRQSQAARYRIDRLIGNTPRTARIRQQAIVAAHCAVSVLLVGPAGSGKRHLAQAIHYRGGEPAGPLVPLDCAVLDVDLLVTTLSTVVKEHPARTREGEALGTLLLNDVDQLPADAQSEFTRLLVQQRTSLRLISTATRPLEAPTSDLACALSTLVIDLPPLAERRDDLPLLAQMFLEELNARGGKQVGSIAPEALDQLATYLWPGNLDELAQTMAEAHERTSGATVGVRDLPQQIHLSAEATARPRRADETVDLEQFLGKVERELIERALSRAKGNKTRAAKLLGMTRPKFYRRLEQLGLASDE